MGQEMVVYICSNHKEGKIEEIKCKGERTKKNEKKLQWIKIVFQRF
jgi:hypothetical protein